MPHKDQDRVRTALLPFLVSRTLESAPEAERDCTVLNRMLYQGPDPLLIMELCPDQFRELCSSLGLSEAKGRYAIEQAHWRGPGVLLDPKHGGLPANYLVDHYQREDFHTPDSWRDEALWLVLAGLSDTTEEGYGPETSVLERMRRVTEAAMAFEVMFSSPHYSPWEEAIDALQQFEASCKWTYDAQGIPITDQDIGFWAGYRNGHKCVGVTHGDKTFYGCVPGYELDAMGVKVDEKVSESYGFVRVPKPG